MTRYRLSARADYELGKIFLFSIENFGFNQARRYKDALENVFSLLAEQPRLGRLAPSIGPGVRRHEHGAHVILYREDGDGILVLAVVHGRSVRGLKL